MNNEFLVANLLDLHTLSGITLLTEDIELSSSIKTVNVMEVPDIYDWTQSNEFLMTTGYSYRNNPLEFLELIPRLKAKGVAALGIKTHRFIDNIPSSVIQCAYEYNLPLFELPDHTVFSNVIKDVMENVLLSQRENQNEFFHNLFNSQYEDFQSLEPFLLRFGLSFEKNSPYYILLAKAEHALAPHTYERLQKSFLSILKDHEATKSMTILQYQNSLMLLLPLKNMISAKLDLLSQVPVLHAFDKLLDTHELSFCISNQASSILNLSAIYEDVLNLRERCILYNNTDYYISWNSLGIYSIISQIPMNTTVNNFIDYYTKVILEYDLFHSSDLYPTLIVFLESNCNMKTTAEKMYLHYNTICYRVRQIKSITGFDFSDIDLLTNLNLAIKLQQTSKTPL